MLVNPSFSADSDTHPTFVYFHFFFLSILECSSPFLSSYLLCLLFLLTPTSPIKRLSPVWGPRQHLYLPFTRSFFPPFLCESSKSTLPRRQSVSTFMFLPASHGSACAERERRWCTKKDYTQLSKLCFCLEDCIGICCQVSLNPTTHLRSPQLCTVGKKCERCPSFFLG